MSKPKFTILETGLWDVPRNEIIAAETPEIYAENRRHTIPGFSVLIKDEKLGNILWDTGIAADWKETWPEQFLKDYSFHRLESLSEKLKEVGLTPADIDLLILSHLHYDHAGNIKLFKGTKAGANIMISEGEAHEAFVNVCMAPNGVSGTKSLWTASATRPSRRTPGLRTISCFSSRGDTHPALSGSS